VSIEEKFVEKQEDASKKKREQKEKAKQKK